jgi:hypothetical protein
VAVLELLVGRCVQREVEAGIDQRLAGRNRIAGGRRELRHDGGEVAAGGVAGQADTPRVAAELGRA